MVELVSCSGCGFNVSPEAAACPKCGHPIKIAAPVKAKKKTESSLIGVGCLYQLLGIVIAGIFIRAFIDMSAPAAIVLGLGFFILFFVIGSRKAVKKICGK